MDRRNRERERAAQEAGGSDSASPRAAASASVATVFERPGRADAPLAEGTDSLAGLRGAAAADEESSDVRFEAHLGLDESAPASASASYASIGRYHVLYNLGSGAMGAVFAALDPKLDRQVAIKLLHPMRSGRSQRSQQRARQRMVREARVLAKLSHDNVVTVYDVGIHGDAVYIVMELVAGQTVKEWLRSEPRSWREVLAVYLAAGRGLQAAHAAGIVHRDVKPANVLIGADGKVRVADFGLAMTWQGEDDTTRQPPLQRAAAASATISAPDHAASGGHAVSGGHALSGGLAGASGGLSSDDRITRTGTVIGTPAYMAPEQHYGERTTPASDLYGFCAALYEGVYGQRPWNTSGDRRALLRAKERENFRDAPGASEAPAWLRRALLRGLAARAEERWPSMSELLAAIDRGGRARPWRWLVAAALALAAVGGTGLYLWDRAQAQESCARAASLSDLWNPGVAAEMREAFARSGKAYAQLSYEHVAERLDAYSSAWTEMRIAACTGAPLANPSGAALPARLGDLRMRCLDERRSALDALGTTLRRDMAEVPAGTEARSLIDQSVAAAAALPPLSDCVDLDILTAAVPLPSDPRVRSAVERMQTALDTARVLFDGGQYDDSLSTASSLLQEADTAGYGPLRARVRYRMAAAQAERGELLSAEKLLREAAPIAAEAADDVLTARIWLALLDVVGNRRQHLAEAMPLVVAVQALVERVSEPRLAAEFARLQGHLATSRGNYAEALEHHLRTLEIQRRVLPEQDPALAATLADLGRSYTRLGRLDEASARHLEALEMRRALLGPTHPDTADSLHSLGNVSTQRGDYDEAWDYFEQALAVVSDALGPDHVDSMRPLTNMANLLQRRGRYDEARVYYERAMHAVERSLGPKHPDVAAVLGNMAYAEMIAGQLDDAEAHYRRALDIAEAALGAAHPHVAHYLSSLANVFHEQGRYAEARAYQERALTSAKEALGSEHLDVAQIHNDLGLLLFDQGEYAVAQRHHEQALAAREAQLGPVHEDVAASSLNLGTVRHARGHADAALSLYERALEIWFETLGRSHPYVAMAHGNLSEVLLALGRLDEAERHIERALVIGREFYGDEHPNVLVWLTSRAFLILARGEDVRAVAEFEEILAQAVRVLGAEHPRTGTLQLGLGQALIARGRHREALGHLERARAIHEATLGAEHPSTADVFVQMAELWLARDRPSRAVDEAEHALALHRDSEGSAPASARFVLARALWARADERGAAGDGDEAEQSAADRARARALAEQARGDFEGRGERPAVARVADWLRAHAEP
ncbi:tetratricopeptide repeat protein [Haliangium ochraceum]|uniref:Serine/threonine protein kinase n=1 Tax=Haliangium ochraceum (strain DSM 14365 / JCM 11303 / SMP-2) TaxID=502025 RepID=D0LTP1_HALO1|nr:tetratricopeptide repeat protein [Haliangium ochraceum]ACY15735.1 serine/threonine protein kinase [Haliangium ochraceum DSM 14365]